MASVSGVNYQLMKGTTAFGTPVAGSGGVISLGNVTTTSRDTFTVRAVSTITGCSATMDR